MINVARITKCNPVATAHSSGLLRAVIVVPASSKAFRKTSFPVIGGRRTGRAGFPTRPFSLGSKRRIGCVVIGPPFLPLDRRKGSSHLLRRSPLSVLLALLLCLHSNFSWLTGSTDWLN